MQKVLCSTHARHTSEFLDNLCFLETIILFETWPELYAELRSYLRKEIVYGTLRFRVKFPYFTNWQWGSLFSQEFINSPLYPIMIISYEMFLRSAEEVRNIKFGLVICDEAHRLKNTTIKTATVSPGTSFPPPPPPPPSDTHKHARAWFPDDRLYGSFTKPAKGQTLSFFQEKRRSEARVTLACLRANAFFLKGWQGVRSWSQG